MQLFRLMGAPDKMIAFDELPTEYLDGVEMMDESRMPRHWREYIGIRERQIRIPPDKDPLTGNVRTYPPLIQKGPYTFVLDREVNKDNERWQEIESFVRRVAPKDFRLLDKLEDMAKPMAPDPHSEITLEPEEIVIIPIPKAAVAPDPTVATVEVAKPAALAPGTDNPPPAAADPFKCPVCDKQFASKQGAVLHRRRAHAEVNA